MGTWVEYTTAVAPWPEGVYGNEHADALAKDATGFLACDDIIDMEEPVLMAST